MNPPPKKAHDIRIFIVSYFYEDKCDDPGELLDTYFMLANWATGLTRAGAGVSVFQRFPFPESIKKDSAAYHFIPDGYGPRLRFWQIPWGLHWEMRTEALKAAALGTDVVIHFNGFIFPLQAKALQMVVPPNCAMVFQHHAERPFQGVKGSIQRWGMGAADMFFFASEELSHPWVAGRFIKSSGTVHPVMEGAVDMPWLSRAEARAKTGIYGNPVLLWTGNLDHNKDPLTILAGFERFLSSFAQARLYMAFKGTELLTEVNRRLSGNPKLQHAVHLLGAVRHEHMAYIFNSADIFVQGSYREGSGISVLEALACGLIPVITDIPSFRTITGNGKTGVLWPYGDAEGFENALLHAMRHLMPGAPLQCRLYFEKNWSVSATGKRALSLYRKASKAIL